MMLHTLLVLLAIYASGYDARRTSARRNGGWSDWASTQPCTVTCGGGSQLRERECDNPLPSRKGRACVGNRLAVAVCNPQPCAGWASWEPWYKCTETCGGGVQLRERACTNPAPGSNDAYCSGNEKETRPCQTNECPGGGQWSAWGSWYKCSATCGGGFKLRERACNNPAPSRHGKYCVGAHQDMRGCNSWPRCPVCKNGMERHFGRCYYFKTCQPGQCSWVEALSACAGIGATLVNVKTSRLNKLIVQKLPRQNVWIGANERDSVQGKSVTWRWNDNRKLYYTFSNWHGGYPASGDHCACLNTITGKWFSAPCQFGWPPMGYACQK